MTTSATEWGAIGTAALAILGWVRTVSRFSARLDRAESDIQALQAKVERTAQKAEVKEDVCGLGEQITKLTDRLEKMDNRRESARGEIGEFRERISRELGEIRAALLGPGSMQTKNGDPRD
jgi:chromosome segregation ATPase